MISTLIVLKIQASPNRKCLSKLCRLTSAILVITPNSNDHQIWVFEKNHAKSFLMRRSNYIINPIPENWVDPRILTSIKKLHKKFKFTIVKTIENAWFSLIFIKNHCFCSFWHDRMKVPVQSEHQIWGFENFRVELFLMRRSNYIINPIPENWTDPSILTCRKKLHKKINFVISQTNEIYRIPCRRHFVAYIPLNPSTTRLESIEISEMSLCSRARNFP